MDPFLILFAFFVPGMVAYLSYPHYWHQMTVNRIISEYGWQGYYLVASVVFWWVFVVVTSYLCLRS